ncbi:hypothetical protein [Campylobacter pinnipediorum]|uniref:hypothetical protein n=1 Tax=Campylobacter pinnipediorum TaxID=1965231 RepID=UPI0009950058|nr:hypothetical protein [Campylobacter pinnipediorum]
MDKINKDKQVRNELIQSILKNDEFKTEFKAMIDLAIRDQLDLDKEQGLSNIETPKSKKESERWKF